MTDHERRDREIEALLRTLDHEPPPLTADDVVEAAGAIRGRGRSTPGVHGIGPWVRAAAIAAVSLTAAAVAFALPGSPLPAWTAAVAARMGLTGAVPPGPVPAPPGGGVALEPADLLVVSIDAPEGGYIRLALTDSGRVQVWAPAGAARFRSAPGRLQVDLLRPDTVDLRIPDRTPRIEVLGGGRRIYLREAMDPRAAPSGTGEPWVIPVPRSP
jgi:hypothetical protein